MDKVAVVTDSSACLPKELVEEYGIEVVPVDLIFEDKVYRDGIDMTPSEFYTRLKQAKKLPTTSAPSPGVFLEVYHKLSQKASSILCVAISSKLSMMFNSAWQAMEMAKEALTKVAISVLDSQSAAGGQGFVALAAARAAAIGKSLAQVIEAAKNMMPRVNVVAMLDTLYYLAKGGRIPKAAAWASSILRVKPILHIPLGEAKLLERVRTRPQALKRLLEIMKERTAGKLVHINLMHANAPDEAQRLKERISSQFDCAELYVTDFTPVMGAHTGPGLLALAFYSGD